MGVRRTERLRRRPRQPWILILGVVVYVSVVIFAPIAALVGRTFQEGLGSVLRAAREPEFLQSLQLTLVISLIIVVIQSVLGTATAWVLERHEFRGKSLINSIIDLPFAVSPVVVGYMLLLLVGRSGRLAPLLEVLNLRVAFAVPGMILATLFVTLPFMIREMGPVIRNLDFEQEQAAATLGANRWVTFRRIVVPALRVALVYGMALTLARSLGEFGAVLVVGGGIIGRTETTTLYVFRALEERNYLEAYTAALTLGLFSVVIVSLADRLRRREE
ncbi:MAG TPA: sulfate ABC transporter permease subunit [Anaerolineales bacterium]|nr:sulfate ABC transporter permease subunit [Anaerolineales bacterium]